MSFADLGDEEGKFDSKKRERVSCAICGAWHHNLTSHLLRKHDLMPEAYVVRFPRSPLMSAAAIALLPKKRATIGEEIELADVPEIEEKIEFVAKEEESSDEEDPMSLKIGCARLYVNKGLTPEQKLFVPKFDQNWQLGPHEIENLEMLSLSIQNNRPCLIVGPSGCGKSGLVSQLAAVCARPLFRINLNGDIRAADFIGDKTVAVDPKSGHSVIEFRYGMLPNAMKTPAWLLIDEIDAGTAHILFVLQAVLEKERRLVLSSNYGEVILGEDGFQIIATANTLGKGDDTGLYAGTNMLNEALLDRFPTVLRMDYPSEETEIKILRDKTGINREDAAGMVEIANQVRKALEQEQVYCTMGTRRLLNWAELAVDVGNVSRAARPAILNRLSVEDGRFVEGLIQRKFGSGGSISATDPRSVRERIKERDARRVRKARAAGGGPVFAEFSPGKIVLDDPGFHVPSDDEGI